MAISLEQVNKTIRSLGNRVDKGAITAAVGETSEKYLAAKQTTLGSGDVGEIKGGSQSLTQELDNAVDKLESTLKPTLAKITETFEGIKAELKPKIADAVKTDLEKITKVNDNADLSVLGDVVEDTTQIDNFEDMNFDITTDGSPEAVTDSIKASVKVSEDKFENALKKLTSKEFEDKVKQAVQEFQTKSEEEIPKAVKALDAGIKKANSALEKALGKVGSGNLIKDAIEFGNKVVSNAVTGNIQSTGNFIEFEKAQRIAGSMLKGDFRTAENSALSSMRVPDALRVTAKNADIPIPNTLSRSNFDAFKRKLLTNDKTKASETAQQLLRDFESDVAKIKKVTTDPRNTTTAAAVKQQDESVPKTSAPIATPQTARTSTSAVIPEGGFSFLNSKEEIVKYLQSAERDITTVIWHWTANYNNQGHIGAEDIHRIHLNRFTDGIGYHFIVKRDGSLQLGRNINRVGAHTAGFNIRSIGISFVAGYNCASGTKNPHKYISAKSITDAQMKTFRTFMESFYTVFPGGQAWGHADFPRNKGKIDPGFDVQAATKTMFGKVNIGHPRVDNKCLTVAEIKTSKQTTIV